MYNLFNHYYSRIEDLWWWWKMKINYHLIETSKTRWLQKCKWRRNTFLHKYDKILFILKKYSYKFFFIHTKMKIVKSLQSIHIIFHISSYIYIYMYIYTYTHKYIYIFYISCMYFFRYCPIILFLHLFFFILWSKFQDWKHFL